jgi:hypothetical protein
MKKSEFKKLIRRQIRSVLLEAKGMVGTGYEPVPTDNAISQQLPLAPGQKIVLKAEGDDARGLVIQHKKSGGYDVFYWYDDPSKATATEVKIDGKNAKKEAKKIFIGFHKVDKVNEARINSPASLAKFIRDVSKTTRRMSYDEKFDMAQNFLRDEDGLEDYLIKKGIGSPVEYLAVRI